MNVDDALEFSPQRDRIVALVTVALSTPGGAREDVLLEAVPREAMANEDEAIATAEAALLLVEILGFAQLRLNTPMLEIWWEFLAWQAAMELTS